MSADTKAAELIEQKLHNLEAMPNAASRRGAIVDVAKAMQEIIDTARRMTDIPEYATCGTVDRSLRQRLQQQLSTLDQLIEARKCL